MDCINHKDPNKLQIVYGDTVLGVHGNGFHYLFSYQVGGMESLVIDGKEWLYRSPKPTFWRATTCNDKGSGFPLRSGMWLSADYFIRCSKIVLKIDGEEKKPQIGPENNQYSTEEFASNASITFTYETITVPSTTVDVEYEMLPTGVINVNVHYHGNTTLPELPVFGIRFIMPTKATSYRYEGLSGETYPDRMDGGVEGIYEIEGLPVTKYLVPQDCNVHMKTKWVEVYRNTTKNNTDHDSEKFGLKISSIHKKFAFSCIPYTAQELENATHHEELPLPRRTVLSILGAVRGVGGINSWGADVEPEYHINAGEDICYSFQISKAKLM
ncbi:MAG TPA: beta-galactosidase small subunit [Lachnoclostridium phytofermentans]|uniref:beta-galactosidase n=1 Tax=Lachnoclostridium phytofermentans TaxID=66219 RepID=A0A3D2XA57_9FIRM|nr:beta-galactosidase small subunit [Lachnoclostridium sp.]HCL03866.1 beta-galactosidase small subunit [Lachnoclostridium phytofermentans]